MITNKIAFPIYSLNEASAKAEPILLWHVDVVAVREVSDADRWIGWAAAVVAAAVLTLVAVL